MRIVLTWHQAMRDEQARDTALERDVIAAKSATVLGDGPTMSAPSPEVVILINNDDIQARGSWKAGFIGPELVLALPSLGINGGDEVTEWISSLNSSFTITTR